MNKEEEEKVQENSEQENLTQETQPTDSRGILFLILILVLIVSVLGLFVLMQRIQEEEILNRNTFEEIYQKTLDGHESDYNYLYNGFVFIKSEGSWETRIDANLDRGQGEESLEGIPFFAHYGPRELENLSINSTEVFKHFDKKNKISLSFNPDLGQYITLSGLEFAKVLVTFYNWPSEQISYGLTNASTSLRYSEINCEDSTRNNAVIVFDFKEDIGVLVNDDCIKIVGPTHEDVLKASTRLMYSIIGIMD